ncbi:MauE/DoxX family redox-associated membrane protein [Flavobacterium sp. TMP13]|uniref:MauE/DoxX family redox-associated membrane protein n=1 Tax=Flavobacterium sp. TMP13 TaxID=3425950 RepID=UPI003D784B66
MKFKSPFESLIVEIICLLFALLFVYAAVSKVLDFENFQVQLGQSPLLSAFAWWISWIVPFLELLIVILLMIPVCRTLGLFCALSLMTMFTVYIFIVLHFSSFIPCSCGGILEKMSWNTHLIFNLIFVLFAAIALFIQLKSNQELFLSTIKLFCKKILITIVLSALLMIVLFLHSEKIMHSENPFIRRYPQHPIQMTYTKDLKFNSYYFSGFKKGRIYLGNYTDALHLISLDSKLKDERPITISFNHKEMLFSSARILVRGNYFYLIDGSVPAVFKGTVSDWVIKDEFKELPYFNLAEPIDSSRLLFRSSRGKNRTSVLGIYSANSLSKITYNGDFLKQQIDGVFDTDGMLLYEENLKQFVYLYYYRNQYVVADNNAKVYQIGNTIDTNSVAKIKVANLKNGQVKTMAAPAQMVNRHSVIFKNLLFVHSTIKGKYENDTLWEQAFIIDVYDYQKDKYLMSFPIYAIGQKKLQSFFVTANHLYAIIGDQLVMHEIQPILKNEIDVK